MSISSLRIQYRQTRRVMHLCSAALDAVNRKRTISKNQALQEAVQWCMDNGCKGWKAVKSGLFPEIKDPRTINSHFDKKLETGNEKSYCKILTNSEENSLIRYMKNRNRCLQSLSEKDVEKVVLLILKARMVVKIENFEPIDLIISYQFLSWQVKITVTNA